VFLLIGQKGHLMHSSHQNLHPSSYIHKIYTLVTALLLLAGWVAFFLPQAYADAKPPVKVGYIFDGDYMYKDSAGAYRGYEVEFLYEIAQNAGWGEISFVDVHNSAEGLPALQSGQVDILMGMSKTPERARTFLFSAKPMVTTYMTLMVRPDEDRYTFGNLPAFQNMTTAVLRGSNVRKITEAWCRDNNLTLNFKEYASNELALQALQSGQVDAMVIGGAYAMNKTRTIAQFSPEDSYFMLTPGRSDLKEQLDRAMEEILVQNPLYQSTLNNKYFGRVQGGVPLLTQAEKNYIAAHKVIRVATQKVNPPFTLPGDNGELGGVLPAYYARLSQLSGFTFKMQPYATFEDALKAVQNNEADVLAVYHNNIFDARSHGFSTTNAFATLNMTELTRKGTQTIRTIGVPSRDINIVKDKRQGSSTSAELKGYDSAATGFEALKNGSVDALVCEMPAATWILNNARISGYNLVARPEYTWEATAAVRGTDLVLRSILNKTIKAAGSNAFIEILDSQSLQQPQGLTGLVDRIPTTLMAGIASASILALILVLFAVTVLLRRAKEERRLAAIQVAADKRASELAAVARANEARNNFFANISHDMRTPLNGILGFTGLAATTDDTSLIRDYLHKISISGHLLLDLVNDILTLSRLGTGKLVLTPEPVQLSELLDYITIPIKAAADAKKVKFILDRSGAQDLVLLADRVNVQKIFLNLLSSAVKFTPAGGTVTFKVAAQMQEAAAPKAAAAQNLPLETTSLATKTTGTQTVAPAAKNSMPVIATHFVVQDTGVGIAADFLAHIYEPFVQEKGMNTDASKGTGLGLSIVKSMVELMGGVIQVASVKGHGTTFTVDLPFASAPVGAAVKTAAASQAPAQITALLQGKQVLLCEDNLLNSEIAKRLLEAKGMVVTCALNGQEGVDAFSGSEPGKFAVILMDVRMPILNGLEATQAIRKLDRPDATAVPIIAMSADAFTEDVKRCLAAGMNGHIAKPIEVEKLYAEIARVLSEK
jgi:signal transduction histidine kinase/ActR/RegA family two-component response regulator